MMNRQSKFAVEKFGMHKSRSQKWRLSVGILTLVALAALAPNASAADSCVSGEAKKALSECPAGKLQTSSGKKPQVSFKSAPKGFDLKKRDDVTKPKNPSESMNAAQRDERRAKMKKKSQQLLVTELQGLEGLFKSTPKKSKDRPKLMRRLAEGYVELEAAAFREMTEAQIAYDQNKKKAPQKAKGYKQKEAKAKKMLAASRKYAIKYYTALKKGYPKWCQNPHPSDATKSSGCTDEVLYYLAYEYEQAKDYEKARKVYFELIQNWAKSKYIPNAYLAFGELFFQEAQGDPAKWTFAEQSYLEVTKYPAPDNKVWGYAHYKLGYVYWNTGDYAKAMSSFKKTIDYGQQYASLPNAAQLAIAARRDIIPVYALSGDPKGAYGFFKPLSGDKGGDNEKTFKMMRELGINYLDTGHYPEGIALYQDLKRRDPGERSCEYQAHISEATLAMKSGDKGFIKRELDNQLATYKEFQNASYPADAKLKCGNLSAGLLAETAMAWHLEAVGSGGVRGTGDPNTMKLSAEIYQQVVDNFTQAQFDQFTFPRIVKEDWPNIFKIKYAMADLLYFQKDWEKCGPAFDSVVAENPTGPEAPEAAYASVLCYQKMYLAQHEGGSDRVGNKANLPSGAKGSDAKTSDAAKFKPKDFSDAQKGMITAFNRYVCYIKPKDGDKEAQEQYVEVKYARARTYFEAQHWEEAAEAFYDVAMNHADHEVGIFASQLYLESMNVLGTHSDPPRPSCYSEMGDAVPKFIELYCQGGKLQENEEQCGTLMRIQRDIERLAAEKLVEAADKGTSDSYRLYKDAADRYMAMWEKYGQAVCEKDDKEACARNEEILYNAAKAYQASRLIAKAIAVRKILINPKYHLHETDLAQKAMYEIGGNYQAIAVYDEAAKWYEDFAEKNPKMEEAPTALQDATVLRLGLGQEDQAIKNADLFNRNYGAKKPAETAKIAFAIGAHYIDKEDWPNARKRLSSAMPKIDQSATLDVKIQAHAMLGRVNGETGSDTGARSEYTKVAGYWKNPQGTIKQLDEMGGTEDEKLKRLGKVLTSVGEAYFYFAEQERKKVDAIKFPEYKGSGERDDVMNHIKTKVKGWIDKKRPAIQAAEKEYLKVVQLEPVPPPRWVIASGARVGQMWGKFVAEFRAAPIPKEWKGEGMVPGTDLSYAEIRGVYYQSLDDASEPQKQQAKAAYKTCLNYSVKYQHFDEYSLSCEDWLSRNYPAEYHSIDEFRTAPNRVNSGLRERAQPLRMDGSPVVDELPDDKKSGGSGGDKAKKEEALGAQP